MRNRAEGEVERRPTNGDRLSHVRIRVAGRARLRLAYNCVPITRVRRWSGEASPSHTTAFTSRVCAAGRARLRRRPYTSCLRKAT